MPTNQPDAAKKAENQKLRQMTITGQRHSTGQSGRPDTPQQSETLPTIDEALQFLVDHGYHKKNTPLMVTSMGEITLKLCSKAKTEDRKHFLEGMRGIGILLKELGVEVMKQVTRGKNIEGAINDIKEGVAKTMKEQKQELEEVKKVTETASKESKEIMNKIAEGMEAMSGKMKEMEESLKSRTQEKPTTTASGNEQQTYAGATATRIPIGNHARAVARGEEAEKQIVIIGKTKDKMAAEGLKTERELIAKADMTLKIMTEEGTAPPERLKFVGAFRAKSGAIIYTLNSKEAATWLKHPDRLNLFNEKYGDSAQAYGKLFNVIAYYVPTTFDAESKTARSDLELDNDLELLGLAHTRYIKPPHKRSKNQTSAHLILGFETRVEANAAIAKRWLTIEGKKVTIKKLIAEPRRCYKCQGVRGDHTADKCPQKESRCARCAGVHSTEQCDQPDNIRCANCNSPNHGAASRDCPVFLKSVGEYMQRSPDGNYRFYPILGDAMSMELLDGSYGPVFTDKPTGSEGTERQNKQANTRTDEENGTDLMGANGLGKLGPVANWGEQEEPDTQDGDRIRPHFSIFN